MFVSLDKAQRLVIETPFDYAIVCQRIPDRHAWDPKIKRWVTTPSRVNIEYLRKELPRLVWSPEAQALADKVVAAGTPPVKADVSDYNFTSPAPYNHQREAFSRTRNAEAYALLMEQRCGKTRADIDDTTDAYLRGLVDLSLIICPNSVKSVWVRDEIPAWTPKGVRTEAILYKASERKDCAQRIRDWDGKTLQYLVVNCEALSNQISEDWLVEQLKGRKVKISVDEASRFKSPTSSRSKALLRFRKRAVRRRIMTGTLITQGPLDAYIPFAFLDPAILGYSSFYAFRGDFALLGGYMGKSVIGYVNTDRLANMIAPFSYRVTRDQCFDMPPKIYSKIEVELSEEQRRIYNDMRDQMLAELDSPDGIEVPIYDEDYNQIGTKRVHQVTATIILTKMLRLQQITGGFFPNANGQVVAIPGKNPKLDALLEELDECQGKSIIWARFRPELALISLALRERYGNDAVVEFHGGVKENDRTENRRRFQDPADPCRFFVGQPDAGGLGIPLHIAHNVFYYSNSFRLEARLQSEDRAQNLEKPTSVGYVDLVAKDTMDPHVIMSLRGKKNLADQVNKDNAKDWI